MTIDPLTAPIDTIRDWLATEKWPVGGQRTDENGIRYWKRCVNEDWSPAHPYPPTLDGAASAMPEGWVVSIIGNRTPNWFASAYRLDREVFVSSGAHDCPSEILARYRLAAACILAQEKPNGS